jgi:hypothetical protein
MLPPIPNHEAPEPRRDEDQLPLMVQNLEKRESF